MDPSEKSDQSFRPPYFEHNFQYYENKESISKYVRLRILPNFLDHKGCSFYPQTGRIVNDTSVTQKQLPNLLTI